MTKQTFTVGQVLTAAQMTSLQQTAMGGGSTTAKTVSYVLLAADAGTVVQMNAAGATTITVNTALFAAGDTVQIQNIGAGVCTVTAGTATVSTAGSLALSQYEGGQLYFNTTSASLFFDIVQASGGGGKVLQVVQGTYSTIATIASTTMTDTGLSLAITPTLNTSKILVMVNQQVEISRTSTEIGCGVQLLRGATTVFTQAASFASAAIVTSGTESGINNIISFNFLDSPATTSATTYKIQARASVTTNSGLVRGQASSSTSVITLMEIGA